MREWFATSDVAIQLASTQTRRALPDGASQPWGQINTCLIRQPLMTEAKTRGWYPTGVKVVQSALMPVESTLPDCAWRDARAVGGVAVAEGGGAAPGEVAGEKVLRRRGMMSVSA